MQPLCFRRRIVPTLFLALVIILTLGTARTATAVIYKVSDYSAENALGFPGGGDMIALNEYTVTGGNNLITGIEVEWGTPAFSQPSLNGLPYTIVLWSDPNGDGLPNDAVVLATANAVIANAGTNKFVLTLITPTIVLTRNFFVGFMINHLPTQAPAGFDQNSPVPNRSFLGGGTSGSGTIYNLGANQVAPAPIESFGSNGNWIICAVAVPEPSPWAMMGMGVGILLCFLRYQRRTG